MAVNELQSLRAVVGLCSWIQRERLWTGVLMIWDMLAEEGSAHRVSGRLSPSPKLKADRRANLLASSSLCPPAQGKVP